MIRLTSSQNSNFIISSCRTYQNFTFVAAEPPSRKKERNIAKNQHIQQTFHLSKKSDHQYYSQLRRIIYTQSALRSRNVVSNIRMFSHFTHLKVQPELTHHITNLKRAVPHYSKNSSAPSNDEILAHNRFGYAWRRRHFRNECYWNSQKNARCDVNRTRLRSKMGSWPDPVARCMVHTRICPRSRHSDFECLDKRVEPVGGEIYEYKPGNEHTTRVELRIRCKRLHESDECSSFTTKCHSGESARLYFFRV